MGFFGKYSFLFVLCLAVLLVYFKEPLMRVYRVATLFHPSKIEENHRQTTEWGMPHRLIGRGDGPIAHLGPAEQRRLPKHFQHEGKNLDLEDFLESHGSTGLVILKVDDERNARVLHERYWRGNNQTSQAMSWSMGKSIISAAFGVATHQGLIRVEEPVDAYFPSLKGSGYEGVPLKHVLQMSSGIRFDEDYFSAFSDINVMGYWLALGLDMDDFVARLVRENAPGSKFHYVSIDTQVLGMVLSSVLKTKGQTLSEYISQVLWSQVGFEHHASILLDNDRSGRELSFGTFGCRTRDFARFGWLFLNQGISPATGQQVIPRQWVIESLTPDAPHIMPPLAGRFFGYGYQWWIAPNLRDFLAIGVYNQFIAVFPEERIVIAKNSAWAGYPNEIPMESEIQTYKAFAAIAAALKDS